jgi:rubrerythrin
MTNIPEDPNAVLEMAIANEIEGRNILLNGRDSSLTPLGKSTFEFLANEELKHIELIKEFAKTLNGVEEWDANKMKSVSFAEAGARIKGIFERFASQFESVSQSDNERLETYQVAMDMEKRGYDFYSEAAEKASDERSKALFKFLAGEEEKHYTMIQDTYEFLKHPDSILAMEERWMQT